MCLLRVIPKNNLVLTQAVFLPQGPEGDMVYLITRQEFTGAHLAVSGRVGKEKGG